MISLPRSLAIPYLIFLAVAVVAAVPMMLVPPLVHDSFWIDYVWAGRFQQELAAGHLYPRWLSGSFHGLGAPVFDFYAPLAFYVTSVPIALGMGVYPAVLVTFVVFHAASGITMHRWLGTRDRAALWGALLYMTLPYHLLDFSRRGALSEFGAYAVLPLVARCIDRIDTRRGSIALAFAYAALIMMHLPTALLVSVLLLPAMILRDPRPKQLLRTGSALALGLLLASVYLLPALLLQRYTNVASMWARPAYRPEAWSVFSPERWPSHSAGLTFVALEFALVVAALALCRKRRFWPAVAIVSCVVAANAIPGFWSLPMLAKVQFPWRALTIAEFAVATAFGQWLNDPARSGRAGYGVLPALLIGIPILLAPYPIGHPTLAELDRSGQEALEYLPVGTQLYTSARAEALARLVPDSEVRGEWTVRRRFWFPGTIVRCGGHPIASREAPGTGLVAYRTVSRCDATMTSGMPRAETIGWLLSGLGLVIAAAIASMPRLRSRRIVAS